MKIRHLSIRNFRGIRALDWYVPEIPTICFIGHGDATKSTILDAIELALSPRWNIQFVDTDFYNDDTSKPVGITVTVGHLSDKLVAKFGEHLRGWSRERGIVDEPENGTELVLSVHLQVTASLEPTWVTFTEKTTEAEQRRTSASDRERIGVTRLGPYIDRHLAWGYGSALSRLTGDLENVSAVLASANREARGIIAKSDLPVLEDAAKRAQEAASKFGVRPTTGSYHPGLDVQYSRMGVGLLALHDGAVPTRQAGLGTRRLLALALQRDSVPGGAILLIDEVESGLEPYRLRHLVRELRPLAPNVETNEDIEPPQIFMTTHSPVVITELEHNEIYVVESIGGETTVKSVDKEVQEVCKFAPEALLGRKILVCEGGTEVSMMRAFDLVWAAEPGGFPFAYLGVVPITHEKGGGESSPRLAFKLANLVYEVMYWGDSDCPLKPSEQKLREAGVQVVLWADKCSLEVRLCRDLSWDGLQRLLELAVELRGEHNILREVSHHLGEEVTSAIINDWYSTSVTITETQIRQAIGKAAEGKGKGRRGWFKREGEGEVLGKLVAKDLPNIPNTDLAIKLDRIREWVYDR